MYFLFLRPSSFPPQPGPIRNQWIQKAKTFSFLLIFVLEYIIWFCWNDKIHWWRFSSVHLGTSELGTFGSETWSLIDGYFHFKWQMSLNETITFLCDQFRNGPQTSVLSKCFHICFDAILIWTDMFIVTHSIV